MPDSLSPSPKSTDNEVIVFFQGYNQDSTLHYFFLNKKAASTTIRKVNLAGSPKAIWYEGTLYVFYQDKETGYSKYVTSTDCFEWSSEYTISEEAIASDFCTVIFQERLYFLCREKNTANVLLKSLDKTSKFWIQNSSVGGIVTNDSLSAVAFKQNEQEQEELYLFYNTQGAAYYNVGTPSGIRGDVTFSDARKVGAVGISYSPNAVVFQNQIYLFHQGADNDSELWLSISYDGTNWQQDKYLSRDKIFLVTSPSAVVVDTDTLYVCHQGGQNDPTLWYVIHPDDATWQDYQVTQVRLSGSPSAVLKPTA